MAFTSSSTAYDTRVTSPPRTQMPKLQDLLSPEPPESTEVAEATTATATAANSSSDQDAQKEAVPEEPVPYRWPSIARFRNLPETKGLTDDEILQAIYRWAASMYTQPSTSGPFLPKYPITQDIAGRCGIARPSSRPVRQVVKQATAFRPTRAGSGVLSSRHHNRKYSDDHPTPRTTKPLRRGPRPPLCTVPHIPGSYLEGPWADESSTTGPSAAGPSTARPSAAATSAPGPSSTAGLSTPQPWIERALSVQHMATGPPTSSPQGAKAAPVRPWGPPFHPVSEELSRRMFANAASELPGPLAAPNMRTGQFVYSTAEGYWRPWCQQPPDAPTAIQKSWQFVIRGVRHLRAPGLTLTGYLTDRAKAPPDRANRLESEHGSGLRRFVCNVAGAPGLGLVASLHIDHLRIVCQVDRLGRCDFGNMLGRAPSLRPEILTVAVPYWGLDRDPKTGDQWGDGWEFRLPGLWTQRLEGILGGWVKEIRIELELPRRLYPNLREMATQVAEKWFFRYTEDTRRGREPMLLYADIAETGWGNPVEDWWQGYEFSYGDNDEEREGCLRGGGVFCYLAVVFRPKKDLLRQGGVVSELAKRNAASRNLGEADMRVEVPKEEYMEVTSEGCVLHLLD